MAVNDLWGVVVGGVIGLAGSVVPYLWQQWRLRLSARAVEGDRLRANWYGHIVLAASKNSRTYWHNSLSASGLLAKSHFVRAAEWVVLR